MPSPRRAGSLLPPGRPLYEEVRAHLTEGIAAGRWKAGEAIPPESELARHFGVAIGTIRKAVDNLVAQGALVRRQGKGTFVTSHDGRRLLFHFFHIVREDGVAGLPGGAHRLVRARARRRGGGGGPRRRPATSAWCASATSSSLDGAP